MKSILTILLCLSICVCTAACGGKGNEKPTPNDSTSQNSGIELPEDKFD